MTKRKILFIMLGFWLLEGNFLVVQSQGRIEINFWHAMSGSRLKAVDNLVQGFNHAHRAIKVEAQFTGSYAETMTKAISATRAGNPPHIIQVYEVFSNFDH